MTQVTIDLGKVKFNWRGAYDGSASYKKDDVVEYGGSSYVCIQDTNANNPSDAAYWELMAQGGNPSSIMTTQGDLLIRGASGLERFPVSGNAGDVLKVNSTQDGYEFGQGGKLIQVYNSEPHVGSWESTTTWREVPGMTHNFTPQRSDSKIKVHYNYMIYWLGGAHSIEHMRLYHNGSIIRSWTEGGQYQEKSVNVIHVLDSWGAGTTRNFQLYARDYNHNGNATNFHGTQYWQGTGGNVGGGDNNAHPVITITEYLP